MFANDLAHVGIFRLSKVETSSFGKIFTTFCLKSLNAFCKGFSNVPRVLLAKFIELFPTFSF